MELKTKYQYTYFIHPYIVDKAKYDKYILRLFKDKRCEFKIFEKEKDMNVYNYFLPSFRDYIFPTFHLRGQELKDFKDLKVEAKSKIVSKHKVCCFTYNLAENVKDTVDCLTILQAMPSQFTLNNSQKQAINYAIECIKKVKENESVMYRMVSIINEYTTRKL